MMGHLVSARSRLKDEGLLDQRKRSTGAYGYPTGYGMQQQMGAYGYPAGYGMQPGLQHGAMPPYGGGMYPMGNVGTMGTMGTMGPGYGHAYGYPPNYLRRRQK